MKELRFHPQFGTLLVTTAEDSFNVFRPNLEPDEETETIHPEDPDEETKQDSSAVSSQKHNKRAKDVWVDSEDEEEEERRIIRAAKELNRQRREKSKSRRDNESKRKRTE
jgi:hypothetical protein